MPSRLSAFFVLVLAFASQSIPATAQPKPPIPVPPPQFPSLTSPANLGVLAGGKTDVTLTGTNLGDATEVLVTAAGAKATIVKDSAKPGSLGVSIEMPKDVAVGLYQVRVVTKHGITNAKSLSVDDLPAVEKKPGNNKKATPMAVVAPCVVTGSIAVESSDFYQLKVNPGQRLTFEAVARRIGSPLDPVLVLHDAKSGREMPALYADDTPGLQSDARLTYTFPAAMDVVVEIRDTTYRGGDFPYRLRIGDFPGATTAFPLAIEKDKTAPINFAGPGLDGVKPATVKGTGVAVLAAQSATAARAAWACPSSSARIPNSRKPSRTTRSRRRTRSPCPAASRGVSPRRGTSTTLLSPERRDRSSN